MTQTAYTQVILYNTILSTEYDIYTYTPTPQTTHTTDYNNDDKGHNSDLNKVYSLSIYKDIYSICLHSNTTTNRRRLDFISSLLRHTLTLVDDLSTLTTTFSPPANSTSSVKPSSSSHISTPYTSTSSVKPSVNSHYTTPSHTTSTTTTTNTNNNNIYTTLYNNIHTYIHYIATLSSLPYGTLEEVYTILLYIDRNIHIYSNILSNRLIGYLKSIHAITPTTLETTGGKEGDGVRLELGQLETRLIGCDNDNIIEFTKDTFITYSTNNTTSYNTTNTNSNDIYSIILVYTIQILCYKYIYNLKGYLKSIYNITNTQIQSYTTNTTHTKSGHNSDHPAKKGHNSDPIHLVTYTNSDLVVYAYDSEVRNALLSTYNMYASLHTTTTSNTNNTNTNPNTTVRSKEEVNKLCEIVNICIDTYNTYTTLLHNADLTLPNYTTGGGNGPKNRAGIAKRKHTATGNVQNYDSSTTTAHSKKTKGIKTHKKHKSSTTNKKGHNSDLFSDDDDEEDGSDSESDGDYCISTKGHNSDQARDKGNSYSTRSAKGK